MANMRQRLETNGGAEARRILLAEDNPSDALLFQLAFTSQNLPFEIDTVPDGERLMSRLRELAETPDRQFSLAVLDVNLPRRTAEEVLSVLDQERIKLDIPVVILSSFLSESRQQRLRQLGVRKILTKPMDFDGYLQLATQVASLCELAKATTA